MKPLCRIDGAHAHLPLYRPYVKPLAHYLAQDGETWDAALVPVSRLWVRHARPWYAVRGRAFTNRGSAFDGRVAVDEGLEAELDDVVSILPRDLRVFLLNRIVDDVLEERRGRQSHVRGAIDAVARRADVP